MNPENINPQDNNLERDQTKLIIKIIKFLFLLAGFCWSIIIWILEPNMIEILVILALSLIFLIYFKILKKTAKELNKKRSSIFDLLYALGTDGYLLLLNILPFNIYSMIFVNIYVAILALLMAILAFMPKPNKKDKLRKIGIIIAILGFVIIIPSSIIGALFPEFRLLLTIISILTVIVSFGVFFYIYYPWENLDEVERKKKIKSLSITIVVLCFLFALIMLTI